MPTLQSYLEYNDPQITLWRDGSANDPYIPRMDSLPVKDGKVTLLEIPSEVERVNISGFVEVDQNKFRNKKYLESNEFLVNYGMGIVQFAPTHEGKTFVFSYYGKGLILIPSSRVYAMMSRNPDVVVTLQDYIDQVEARISENKNTIDRVEQLIVETRGVIDSAILATDNANIATEKTERATALALDAYNTTRLVFKEPVAEFRNIPTAYPTPLVGWTVQTYKDGKRYRFDGSNWISIDIFGENLQVVNEDRDGLMSVAEHLKLKSYPDTMRDRVVILSLPDAVQGIVVNHFDFPFRGEIIELYASCETAGETVTEISLERTRDLVNWTEVTDRRLRFQPGANYDDKQVTFRSTVVQPKDIFRINMNQQGLGFYNLKITFIVRT